MNLFPEPLTVIILMGVSGSGKSTVGRLLAERVHWRFLDADDFHSAHSVQKMARGEPLTDGDRLPWLLSLRHQIENALTRSEPFVLACSALRMEYRKVLRVDAERVRFIYLRGDAELIAQRSAARTDHFMPPNLLPSQLATLEEPRDPRDAIAVDIAPPPEAIVESILAALFDPHADTRT
jgi:gluconokinase